MLNAHALVVVVFGLWVFARFVEAACAAVVTAFTFGGCFSLLRIGGEAQGDYEVLVLWSLGNVEHPVAGGAILHAVFDDEVGVRVEGVLAVNQAIGISVGKRFAGGVEYL